MDTQGILMALAQAIGSTDDSNLAGLAASGDVLALEGVYDAYGASLYRLAIILVGDAAGAEVAVCEGFRLLRSERFGRQAQDDPWRELVQLTLLASWTIAGEAGPGAALSRRTRGCARRTGALQVGVCG